MGFDDATERESRANVNILLFLPEGHNEDGGHEEAEGHGIS